jgi:two-component system, cell cycle sensor histidine kinase and response regulator CckA
MPAQHLWNVKIDPYQIDQILANLMVNARDAIGGIGKITIETAEAAFNEAYCANHAGFIPGEFVLLAVSDDGAGMSKEVVDHIFEPFFTTKELGEGTGLGLSTVYGIVKQNDGFINVYSEPGLGTTMKIYLPRFEAEAVEAPEQGAEATPHRGTETVLMVEDEEAILNVGKMMLERLGYTVLAANAPGRAISLATEFSGTINLLIIDIVMPEMTGLELAERITSIKPGVKCLYMSGYTASVITHRNVLNENVNFISKPFSLMELSSKVREALEK